MMNSAVEPALIALTGGGAMLTWVYLHERSIERYRRAGRKPFRLTFPRGVSDRSAAAALAALAGADGSYEFVFETRATEAGIEHYLHTTDEIAAGVGHQLAAAVPGLRIDMSDDVASSGLATLSLRLFIPALSLLRTEQSESACRAVLGNLAHLRDDEEVRAYLSVRAVSPRVPEAEPATTLARDHHRRLRARVGQATFSASGLIHVKAGSKARARELLDGIGQALRSRSAHDRPLRLTYDSSARRLSAQPKTSRHGATLTADELVGLTSWPIGDIEIPQVSLGATRVMLVPRNVGREGVRLFTGRDVSGDRPVRLPPSAQRIHTFVAGATGAGKSTLIARVSLDALAAGQAGLVVDPKDGSLIQMIIDRVPDAHRDRVIVVSPADRRAPVGLDLFAKGDADTRAEAVTATLRAIYGPQGAFGVRSEHWLPLAIRSLAALPHPNFLLIGRLFSDARLRQQVVARLNDPILKMAWAAYDDLPPEAQRAMVAAPVNRLMGLLQRPPVRATLAQPFPRVNLGEVWRAGGWVLVDLGPGVVGEAAARLMGGMVTFLALATLEARAGQPESARVPTNLIIDELTSLADTQVSVERLAERSRAYGGQLLLATQAASRLPTAMTEAIFGNFASILAFKAGADEARRLARELSPLGAQDLIALPPYGVAARLATGRGTGSVIVTGRTEPLEAETGNADYIRAHSSEHYGTPREELERDIETQLSGEVMGAEKRPAPGRSRRAS
jgi:hypothetical protein